VDLLLAQATGDVADLGKAIAFGVGVGLGAVGAGIGIGNIFGSMIQAVARQPELRGELTGHPVARLRARRGGRLLRPPRRPLAYVLV
jgi:F0F1-type ATP synthase membrane subunit c/vacuolar-type H+-ATPase subunit K